MAEMSMNRAIHGAVRRDLARFLDALGRFSDGDRGRAQQLAKAWANFDSQLTWHHEGEHDIAWPALEKVGASKELLAQMDAEHERLAEGLAGARTAMATLAASGARADAEAAHQAMERLQSVAVEHLEHEEAEIEPIYLANREAPAIKEMGRQFAKVKPSFAGVFFAWVTNGATPDEMRAVTHNVPKPVLAVLRGVFGRPYRKDIAPIWTS